MPVPDGLDSPLGRRLQTTPNVILMEGYQVQRVEGDQYARRLIVSNGGDVCEVQADAFFVEFNPLPNSAFVFGLVERDPKGYIKIDAHNRTSASGIFAAGDVTDAFAEQVLIAIGEGAKAALSAYEYLLEHHPLQHQAAEPLVAGEWR
jgi:alkyl hydroperoxide reductase subunit AhpF